MTATPGALAFLAGATSSKSSSSGSSSVFLIILVIGAAFYFFLYRPQQRKQKAAREQANRFEVGDEVLTAGGIVGYVIDIDGERVTLETSVGASFVVLKQYVIRRLEEPAADGEDDGGGDYDDFGDDIPGDEADGEYDDQADGPVADDEDRDDDGVDEEGPTPGDDGGAARSVRAGDEAAGHEGPRPA